MNKYHTAMAPRVRTAFLLVLVLLLTGCWDREELDTLGIVMGSGLDTAPDDNGILFSGQVIRPGGIKTSGGGGGSQGGVNSQQGNELVTGQGKTVVEAIRNAAFRSSRRLDFTHNEVLVLGKGLAQKDLHPAIDHAIRDPEQRPNRTIVIADGKAQDVLKADPGLETGAASNIFRMLTMAWVSSKVNQISVQDMVEVLASKTAAAAVPIVRVSQTKQKTLSVNGSAIIKGGRWVGSLDQTQTRGLLWVLGKVKQGAAVVTTPGGERVTLEITDASSSFKPELNAEQLRVNVKIHVQAFVNELPGLEDMSTPEGLLRLEKLLGQTIRREVQAAVTQSRMFRADIFDFGGAFRRRYPREWKKMELAWDGLFPRIQVSVAVDARIRWTGNSTRPLSAQ